jgi:hypothetical protein
MLLARADEPIKQRRRFRGAKCRSSPECDIPECARFRRSWG